MKKFIFIPFILSLIAGYALISCKHEKQAPEKAIAQNLLMQIDSFSVSKNKLLAAVENGNADEKQLQTSPGNIIGYLFFWQ